MNMIPIPFISSTVAKNISSVSPNIDNKFFPGWNRKAVTFSYDDGPAQDEKLTGIFRQYGLKATFNLISRQLIVSVKPVRT